MIIVQRYASEDMHRNCSDDVAFDACDVVWTITLREAILLAPWHSCES